MIRRTFIDKESNIKVITDFKNIKEASASINTPIDDWKVQMLIVYAINTKKRAFKAKWEKIK